MSPPSPGSHATDPASPKKPVDRASPRDDAGRRSRRHRFVFRLVVVSFPFALLAAAEGVARLAGYGGYPPAIKYVGSDGRRPWYSTYRPGVDTYFYSQLSLTGGMRSFAFVTPKPPDTVRIAFFGGSAMQGYPQPLPLTNGAFLQAMLQDVWGPSRRVEVLNFGATAMASFPAMEFLKEALPHELDLVVIMSGNNEFYGAYGVASLHRSGISPAGMRMMRWLRSLGLKQWIDARRLHMPPDPAVRKQPLMERVVAVAQVGPDDALREAAETSLRTNLVEMVECCRARNVPVIVCTVPTNESGMAPIGEDVALELGDADAARFNGRVAEAERLVNNEPAKAAEHARAALSLWSKHARTHYMLARALARLGKHEAALAEFIAARDLDTMPWRATSAARRAVLAAAGRGATLCDMEAAFRAASPGGAIGWELMDDHVHMTLRGQALFAETIARTMGTLSGPLYVDSRRLAMLPDWRAYAARFGHTPFDDYTAQSRMRVLFDIGFMRRSNPEATDRVARRCEELLAAMSPADRAAVATWEDPGLHVTDHRPITGVVGYFRLSRGDYAGAAPLFRVARECVSNVSLWRLQYTWYLLDCIRHLRPALTDEDRALCAEAIEVGELLRRFAGFRDPLGPSYLGMAYHLAGRYDAAVAYLDDAVRYAKGWEGVPVVEALADSLIRLGRVDRARMLLNLARRDPAMVPTVDRMRAALGDVAGFEPAGPGSAPASN